ncbi:hypothetical protein [Tenuibacillus multivorans]|uniref:Uncharacterized protein n=1 Tax=Tenuibacillus multivorans TaxID=237069 RepID=A0A1H0B725_9BACI|nr:hypothetical protein [Tenuibacillus multivorans]GEL78620.1 hypothetical protein TMU01_28550 [Tenuibacillus multivorans]SDN41352.1 hypothetical protein SAMN05216498_2244 [Tenuibacillus multivorans]
MTFTQKIMSKYAASFAAFFGLVLVYFLLSNMHIPDTYNLVISPLNWTIYGVYLIIASYIIDRILHKFNTSRKWSYINAYILAGVFIWVVLFIPVLMNSFSGYIYVVLYGSMFTVFPFIGYYLIENAIRQSWGRIIIVGFPALIILVSFLIINPTIKSGFTSDYSDQTYTAEFEQLNGTEEINIPVEEGKTYDIDIMWSIPSESGYGMRVNPNLEELGDMKQKSDWIYQFEAKANGTLDLIYYGHNIEGSLTVEWTEL